ncbi:MAG: hypothetical protein ABIM89_10365 [Mycobacteriales bacterium]
MSVEPYAALEAELRALSAALEFPPTPDLAGAVTAQLGARPSVQRRAARWWNSPRTTAIAAGIVALLAAVLVLSPGAREAVASIFRGVRGIRIVVDQGQPSSTATPTAIPTPTPTASPTAPALSTTPPTPSTTPETPSTSSASPSSAGSAATTVAPAPVFPGTQSSLDEVRAAVAFEPLLPPALGPPDRVLFEKDVANGMVTMVWQATPSLPAAAGDIGAVLTQFAPEFGDDFPYWLKSVQSEGRLDSVRVGGRDATWVEGGHRLDFRIPDAAGWTQVASSRIAANTLVWVQNGVTVRLETALTREAAIRLAESLH